MYIIHLINFQFIAITLFTLKTFMDFRHISLSRLHEINSENEEE